MDPIERVREGMRVLDATGSSVGTVAEVRFNGRGATTAAGQSPDHGGGATRPRTTLLERIGYVTVDAGEPLGDPTVFCADDIIAVQCDTVHITHGARPAATA
jgi:hypothetical protein